MEQIHNCFMISYTDSFLYVYKTTWGLRTFKDQANNQESWVYKRLKAVSVVLVAKLVTSSLAYGDIWFGRRTRNPCNIEEYLTGSRPRPTAGTFAELADPPKSKVLIQAHFGELYSLVGY